MLEVTFTINGKKIGVIEIQRLGSSLRNETDQPGEFADYSIKYMVERGDAIGMHKRVIYGFPRKYYNVFALCLQALNALNEKDLELERDFDPDQESEAPVPTDMARGLGRALQAIQGRLR
jgi:hypothetical protein